MIEYFITLMDLDEEAEEKLRCKLQPFISFSNFGKRIKNGTIAFVTHPGVILSTILLGLFVGTPYSIYWFELNNDINCCNKWSELKKIKAKYEPAIKECVGVTKDGIVTISLHTGGVTYIAENEVRYDND